MRKSTITLVLIIILSLLLRLYQLTTNPPSLNIDEVAIGFNAKMIGSVGRDEYGQFLPLMDVS